MFEFLSSQRRATARPEHWLTADKQASAGTTENSLDDYDDGPFEIVRNFRQLVHILRQTAEARQSVTLSSPHLGAGIATRLLGIDANSGMIFIRQLCNEQLHSALVGDRRFNLFVRQEESAILLSLTLDRLDTWNRQGCYVATLPTWALSSQMRAWRRVHLPPAISLTLSERFPDKDGLEARVIDISEGGMGLVVPHLPLRGIRLHERWQQTRLAYGKIEIAPLVLQVRHFRNEAGTQRIGLMVEQASEGQCQHLRRLLLRLQTAQH